MLNLPRIGHKPGPPPGWRKANAILARMREDRLTGAEQEDRCLEAMLHWRDPVGRAPMLRRRQRTLVDDNPSSG